MRYLALRDFGMHAERVKARADAGGHSASETTLLETYRSSLANLPKAIAEWMIFGSTTTRQLEDHHGWFLKAREA